MGVAARQGDSFSYADYLQWDDDTRWELVNGRAWAMTPAPGTRHQQILSELHGQIWQNLKGTPCQVLSAPFDVRLPQHGTADSQIDTVLQPDLTVVCDTKRLDHRGCLGAPDMVVEILSPTTAQRDLQQKFAVYESHGVQEYWIVYPGENAVMVYILDPNGRYGNPGRYTANDTIQSVAVPAIFVDLKQVFPEK